MESKIQNIIYLKTITHIILLLLLSASILSCGKETTAPLNLENSSQGTSSNSNDSVIQKNGFSSDTQFATWLMIWNRSSESWWNPNEHNGAQVFVQGRWQSINWKDHDQADEFISYVKEAGIDILICDLTNGWDWLDAEVQYIQSLCKKNGLKLCVAENSTGDVAKFESHAKDIWNRFAGPSSPYGEDTYFMKDGKPVIVCYSIRNWYNSYKNSNGKFTNKFDLIWASGEDSDVDKWGWQLEPWIGPKPSKDAVFVTPSIRWNPVETQWRSSLSWLDYTFLMAALSDPKYVIVSSYDDLDERNAWLEADTKNSIPDLQMRNPEGDVSIDAYYNRVQEWIKSKPSFVKGGHLMDGCYKIKNVKNGKYLSPKDKGGTIGSRYTLDSSFQNPLDNYFWIYYLGDEQYRIISLNKGLSLTISSGESKLRDGWTINEPEQKWVVEINKNGYYKIKNVLSGEVIQLEDGPDKNRVSIIQAASQNDASQEWQFEKIVNFHDL